MLEKTDFDRQEEARRIEAAILLLQEFDDNLKDTTLKKKFFKAARHVTRNFTEAQVGLIGVSDNDETHHAKSPEERMYYAICDAVSHTLMELYNMKYIGLSIDDEIKYLQRCGKALGNTVQVCRLTLDINDKKSTDTSGNKSERYTHGQEKLRNMLGYVDEIASYLQNTFGMFVPNSKNKLELTKLKSIDRDAWVAAGKAYYSIDGGEEIRSNKAKHDHNPRLPHNRLGPKL